MNYSDILARMTNEDADFFRKLGEKIAGLRKESGLTQSELGEKLEVSQPVIASYESGRRRVPTSALPTLVKVLGIDLDELLGLDQPKGKRGRSGRLDQMFDEVSRLPKSQQKRILATLEDMLIAQHAKAS